MTSFKRLKAFNEKGLVCVVIDTPKGSRNKYKYDEELEQFWLKSMLGEGLYFPYNFGFVPSTRGEDGDPLDVLLLMEEPAFPGCIIYCRVIGVLEADQKDPRGKQRYGNDRYLGVADFSRQFQEIRSITDLNKKVVDEIENFFISYNLVKGKEFRVLKRSGAKRALALLRQSIEE